MLCGDGLSKEALVGRQPRPLDPTAGPVESFAAKLRSLREQVSDLRNWLRDTPVDVAFRDRNIPEGG